MRFVGTVVLGDIGRETIGCLVHMIGSECDFIGSARFGYGFVFDFVLVRTESWSQIPRWDVETGNAERSPVGGDGKMLKFVFERVEETDLSAGKCIFFGNLSPHKITNPVGLSLEIGGRGNEFIVCGA